jgi:hypothetical protein
MVSELKPVIWNILGVPFNNISLEFQKVYPAIDAEMHMQL